jgi:starch synthase
MNDTQPLKILYLSAEVVPFAKTGGLADVAGALPKAIRGLGHDIRVIMPRYGRIEVEKFGLKPLLEAVSVPMDERSEAAVIWQGSIGSGPAETPVYFVESARYFDRQGIYMYPDDAERFIFFSRAALELCRALGWQPDVIHCNEWHTALIPNWLKTIYREDPFFAGTATLYTAHNLEYQGIFGHRVLEIAGLADLGFIAHPDVAPDLNEVVDMMARGLLFADIINTVSETYAREILTPEFGQRLDPILRDRRDRLFGILNGIDTELYNPATDPNVAVQFDASSLDRRVANKAALQAEVGLPGRADVPLLGAVSRLIDQKGFDLIDVVVDPLIRQLGCQLVVMGTGEMRYHDLLNALAARYGDQVRVFLTFNKRLEQRIYASADIFLMPSRFEPCGLNQMVAMRYGCVPAVHAVGGLADTVSDFSPETGQGNGFSFAQYDPMAFYTAVVRAVETYRHRDVWRQIVRRCMTADFSWTRSALKYVDLYFRSLAARRQVARSLDDYEYRTTLLPRPLPAQLHGAYNCLPDDERPAGRGARSHGVLSDRRRSAE